MISLTPSNSSKRHFLHLPCCRRLLTRCALCGFSVDCGPGDPGRDAAGDRPAHHRRGPGSGGG